MNARNVTVLTLAALLTLTACHKHDEDQGANPDSAAGKTGQAAYEVSKGTEKAAKEVGKVTEKAAKAVGHEVHNAAKDIHEGWKEASEKDKEKQ